MKKIYSLLFLGLLLSFIAKSQTIMWTDSFINGQGATPAQVTAWNNFRAQLTPNVCYSKMVIKGTFDTIGQVCTDPTIVSAYANALNTVTAYTSPLTNGNVWSLCNRYSGEVWLNPPSQCSGSNCPTGYIIRPAIGGTNPNWGGVNTATCGAPNQRMTFIFYFGTSSTISASACNSYISPSGNYTWTSTGIYMDTVPNSKNCDSVITVNLTINSTTSSISPTACATYTSPSGKVFTSSGTYSDTIPNAVNCDSIISINLTINPLPIISITSLTNDTVCVQTDSIALPNASPSGGSYSGTGVSGNSFSPSNAGVGSYYIVYTYTDNNNCTNSDSVMITVDGCVGINEFENYNISIYPNPTNGLFTIDMGRYNSIVNYTITSIDGRIVAKNSNITDNKIMIDLSNESKGVYLLKLYNTKSSSVFRINRL